MNQTPGFDFSQFVPGFDFLKNLQSQGAAAGMGPSAWVAPTLDPQELEKRIQELKAVQFWLNQNTQAIAATIQALEVQRMTLSTLKTMNVQVADLQESMRMRMPEAAAPAPASSPAAAPKPAPSEEPPAARRAAPRKSRGDKGAPAPEASAAGIVDPTQWWNAITQQFTQLAANALKDSSPEAMQKQAGAMVNQGLEAAGRAFGAGAPGAKSTAGAGASKTASGGSPTKRKAAGGATRKKAPAPARRPR